MFVNPLSFVSKLAAVSLELRPVIVWVDLVTQPSQPTVVSKVRSQVPVKSAAPASAVMT